VLSLLQFALFQKLSVAPAGSLHQSRYVAPFCRMGSAVSRHHVLRAVDVPSGGDWYVAVLGFYLADQFIHE